MAYTKLKFQFNYSQVPNEVWADSRLAWKEKALFGYLISKPDCWDFSYQRIAKDAADGEKAVLSGLRKLEETGYLKRKKLKDGRVEYQLFISSQVVERANCPEGSLLEGQSAEKDTISNTDDEESENINKKELKLLAEETGKPCIQNVSKMSTQYSIGKDRLDTTVAPSADPINQQVAEIIDVFKKSINPAISFGHKTFRQAAADLIKQFGFEATLNTARAAVAVQGKRFAPVIVNPYQLKLKAAELGVYLQKEQDNKFSVAII